RKTGYVAYGTSMSRKPPRRLLRLAPVFLPTSPSTPRAVFPGPGFPEPPPGGRILAGTVGLPAIRQGRTPAHWGWAPAQAWVLCMDGRLWVQYGGQAVNRTQK